MRLFMIFVVAVLAALVGAFFYFSDPDIPRPTLEAKYATPPSQFVHLTDGARAHVRDRGPRNAPVLVLIHGNQLSLFTWEPWASRLDDTFRVVTMDLPGHGLTGAVPSGDYTQKGMVEFVKAVADQLGLGPFIIGGHSMGGGIAVRFAEIYPHSVTRLVLIDAVGMPSKPPDPQPWVFRALRAPVLNQLLLHITPRSMVAQTLNDLIVRKSKITNQIIDQTWDFARMSGTRRVTLARYGLPRNSYIMDHIGQVKAPTLILWGEEDRDIPVADAHGFAKAIPGSKLIAYPGIGHFPQDEIPDQSATDVRAFLAATDKPKSD
jgi:pimeloyl-ACP methyl ester carboxylesterase